MIKIYTETEDYQSEYRGHLMDLLKPFVGKDNDTKNTIKSTYGDFYENVVLTNSIEESEFCVLPFSWNYYSYQGLNAYAKEFVENCLKAGKPVLTFTTNDFGCTPLNDNVIVLRQSGYASHQKYEQWGLPVFIRDPLEHYFDGQMSVKEKGEFPVVGFCGQAHSSFVGNVVSVARTCFRNMKYHLKLSINEPQTLYPTSYQRDKILTLLDSSPRVNTQFVKRKKYRAGVVSDADRLKTGMEFYNNIRNTDYTMCVRGGGNFSVRLYETLAMGRIPLFVNTDCILPLADSVDWSKHVVWVDISEVNRIGDILADFHNSIHPDDFKQLQIDNRKFWEDSLSFDGFHSKLIRVMKGQI
jgi:hypothetical protein